MMKNNDSQNTENGKRFILKNDWVYDNGTYIDKKMMVELLKYFTRRKRILEEY